MEHLNLNAIAELKEVMEEEFGILIETFLQDSLERLDQLRQALSANDAEEFGRAAHSFKGSCTNIGATILSEHCLKAERMGKSGKIVNGDTLVQQIAEEFVIVDKLLRETL